MLKEVEKLIESKWTHWLDSACSWLRMKDKTRNKIETRWTLSDSCILTLLVYLHLVFNSRWKKYKHRNRNQTLAPLSSSLHSSWSSPSSLLFSSYLYCTWKKRKRNKTETIWTLSDSYLLIFLFYLHLIFKLCWKK